MKTRINPVVLAILLVLPAAFVSSDVLAQELDLQPGDKAQVFVGAPVTSHLEGTVTETWVGGFEMEVRGESMPHRVDLAEVVSLQRQHRLGRRI